VSRPRLILRLAVAPLLAVVLAGCANHPARTAARSDVTATSSTSPVTAPSSVTAAASTAPAQKTFAAYRADGTLAVAVGAHRSGSCFAPSIVAARAIAYRCIAGNAIEDPCFAAAGRAAKQPVIRHPVIRHPVTLACFGSPWSSATVLTVSGPLPARTETQFVSHPWALQLSNGARCVATTGTVPTVDGVSLSYQCGSDRDAGIVGAQSSAAQVGYGSPSGTTLTRVAIATIWSG
jgi:hypothetical protein